MAVPKTIVDALGSWAGESTLHMSWMPEGQRLERGPSKLHVELAKDKAYAVVSYTWTYKGATEEGHMIVTSDKSETTIGWSDSWHQNTAVMLLRGKAGDEVDCKGSYKVQGHPDWHWRVTFSMVGDKLLLRMFNISPEGQEEPAVEAVYSKD